MGLLGGIGDFLFGKKPKAGSNESGNNYADYIKNAYGGMISGGTDAFGQYGNALGIGGNFAGQKQAFDNYLNNSGYGYVLDQGMQGVTNSAAGKYLLRSGATAKALQDRALNIGKTFYENYLDRLSDMSRLGLGAGSLVSGAGQFSKGTGSTQGTQGSFGDLLSLGIALFSDERLKDNIEPTGRTMGGVPEVEFEYRQDTGIDLPKGRQKGVLAQAVAKLRPDALGPIVKGFLTVDYRRLLI